MSSHPSDIEAGDLWAQLTAVPLPHRPVPFVRKLPSGDPVMIDMVVLTHEETMAITASTERWVRAKLKDAAAQKGEQSFAYESLFESRSSCELLFRCCRKVDDIESSFFPTPDSIQRSLTTDEIAVLVLDYTRLRAELGPIVHELSQDELDAWIELLVKGASSVPFAQLSLGAQHQLLMHMASLSHAVLTANSSHSTPPEST